MSEYRFPDHYLLWPYFGADDALQDGRDTLERAAEMFTPGGGARAGSENGRRPRRRTRRSALPSAED
jgi:hypothetical protein